MEIRRFKNELLKDYVIVNESGSTRSGFYHKSTIMYNDVCEIAEEKANYINRTWECYQYQTSMQLVVEKAKRVEVDLITHNYKYRNQITRITKKHREELDKIIADNETIKLYDIMLKELDFNRYHYDDDDLPF